MINENLRRVSEYIGWGDPMRGIWFVGVEESDEWSSQQEIDSFLEKPELIRAHGIAYRTHLKNGPQKQASTSETNERKKRESQIGICEAQLAAPTSNTGKDPQSFKMEDLWKVGSGTFHCNLFPVGKTDLNARPEAAILFGLTSSTAWDEYYSSMRATRFSAIREFWSENATPQATVCLGITHWGEFESLFDITADPVHPTSESGCKIKVCESKRIVLVGHWAYGSLTTVDKAEIHKILKRWKVQLP